MAFERGTGVEASGGRVGGDALVEASAATTGRHWKVRPT